MQVEYLTQCLERITHLLRRDDFNNKLDEAIFDGNEDESIYDDKSDEDRDEDIGTPIIYEAQTRIRDTDTIRYDTDT